VAGMLALQCRGDVMRIAVDIPVEELDRLEALAKAQHISRDELIRRVISDFLNSEEQRVDTLG
jgi:metal-responsive CopG/Arc/MetJ family transcriptional regulator